MLGKLMKHEFRATGRMMLPVFLAVVLLGTFTAVSIYITLTTGYWAQSSLLSVLVSLMFITYLISLIVAYVFCYVIMVRRFQKNLLTDEGYLMFTLPVNTHQLLWSKLLVSYVWFAASFLLIIASYAALIFGFIGMFPESVQVFEAVGESFSLIFQAASSINWLLLGVEYGALLLLSPLSLCLAFYAPIALGHSFSNKKILLSVVFYFANQSIWHTIGSVFGLLTLGSIGLASQSINPETALFSSIHVSVLSSLILTIAMAVILYIVTYLMLTKRRNLQ